MQWRTERPTRNTLASVLRCALTALLIGAVGASTARADTVRFADGGFLRGTVLEYVPGDHVTIELASGEVRTLTADQFVTVEEDTLGRPEATSDDGPDAEESPEANETVEAPLPSDPVPAPPPPTRNEANRGRPAPLQVSMRVADGLLVHEYVGSGGNTNVYELLCEGTCDLQLARGVHRLGVSEGPGRPRPLEEPLMLRADSVVTIGHESDSLNRVLGWVGFAAAFAAGVAISLAGLFATEERCDMTGCRDVNSASIPLLVTGGLVAAVGCGISLVFALDRDDYPITVAPR